MRHYDFPCRGRRVLPRKITRGDARAESQKPGAAPPERTVLNYNFVDDTPSTIQKLFFFEASMNASDTPWSYNWVTQFKFSPLENYFVQPDSPYTAIQDLGTGACQGEDIWPIGDSLFSRRVSQLLNTWWITNVAPFAVTGDFRTHENGGDAMATSYFSYQYQNTTGSSIADMSVLRCNHAWLTVLFIASSTILVAGLLAAAFGSLRRGPEVLGYSTSLLRDSPHVSNAGRLHSMEDAVTHARRLQNVKVVLGDTKAEALLGHIAVGTTDAAEALHAARRGRIYT